MVEVRVEEYPVCDFCSDIEPRYLEDCETFESYLWGEGMDPNKPEYIGKSLGAWAACEVCHRLIDARKWATLKRRAVDAMCRKHPEMPRNRVEKGVDIIHGTFRAHKPVSDINP